MEKVPSVNEELTLDGTAQGVGEGGGVMVDGGEVEGKGETTDRVVSISRRF